MSNLLTYLTQNGSSIVDYCRRYWSGRPVSSSLAETTVNCLVNARMNKKRQMRWSPTGTQRVLQVRTAVIDGRLKHGTLNLAISPPNPQNFPTPDCTLRDDGNVSLPQSANSTIV